MDMKLGSIEVVIKGGRPWGFTLQGGVETGLALTVAQIEPHGKAHEQGGLRVGDRVLKINDVQCLSLTEAIQLIDSAFRTLTVLIWRSSNVSSEPSEGLKYPAILRRSFRLRSSVRKAKGLNTSSSTSAVDKVLSNHQQQQSLAKQQHDLVPREGYLPPYHHPPPCYEDPSFSRHFGDYVRGYSPVRSRHPSGVSSASSSTQDTGQVVLPRHPRSPRKLTKDSGYETSIQGEPDYVNSDWLSEGTCTPVFGAHPPPPVHSSSLHDMSAYWTPSVSGDESTDSQRPLNMNRRESRNLHRSLSYIRDQFEDRLDPSTSVESLNSGRTPLLHPTKSVSSLASLPGEKHPSPPHPLSPPPYHHQVSWPSCVLPSRSTPNLDQEVNMVTRTFKKRSVYETLASKSGLDFAPVIQRPPYWERREIFEEERCHQIAPPVQRRVVSRDRGRTGVELSTVGRDRSTVSHGAPKGKVSPPPIPPPVGGREGQRSPSPPPVPIRSHSEEIYNKRNSIHEKYPSWPVTFIGTQTSSHRSNSWTEHTDYPKEKAPYSRPKETYQISVHQLHPVHEGGIRRPSHKDECPPRSPGYAPPLKTTDAEFALSKTLESSLSFGFDSLYTIPYNNRCHSNKDYNIHSPPERDISCPVQAHGDTYRYEDMIRYYSHTAKFYGHWAKGGGSLQAQTLHVDSTTPLLDRLRRESESLPHSWSPHITTDLDAPSEVSTCQGSAESTSSSQETLKWHGSYSDISTLSFQASNRSSQFDSGHSTLADSGGRLSPQSFCSTATITSTEGGTGAQVVARHGLHQESVAHSAKVEPPQRHDSESVLYYAPGSKQGHKRAIREGDDSRRYCGRTNHFYAINHEENISDSRHSPNQAFSASFPGFSRTVQYDSHDPHQVEIHCSPVSPRSSHSISKLKVSGNRLLSGSRRNEPTSPTAASPGGHNRVEVENSNQRMVYLDPSKRHRVSDPELKAIQKRAVLSFYHRQTSMASANQSLDGSNASTPVSSPTRPLATWSQSSWDVDKLRARLSSESASHASERSYDGEGSPLPEFTNKSSNTLSVPCRPSKSTFPAEDRIPSEKQHLVDRRNVPVVSSKEMDSVVQQHRDPKDQSLNNNKPTSSFWLNKAGRRAQLKKVYNSNETAVVKLISPDGITLVEAVEKGENRKADCKPQVPPKPVNNKGTFHPSANFISQPLPVDIPSPLTVDAEGEDEELKRIDESVKSRNAPDCSRVVYTVSPLSTFSESTCSSPDLPLPPPPSNSDTEVLNPDDPLPPPPPEMTGVEAFTPSKTQSSLSSSQNAYVSYTDEEKAGKQSYRTYSCYNSPDRVHQTSSCSSPCPKEQLSPSQSTADSEAIYENVCSRKHNAKDEESTGSQRDISSCGNVTTTVSEHISPVASHTNSQRHFGCDVTSASVSLSSTVEPSGLHIDEQNEESIYVNLECPQVPNGLPEVKDQNHPLPNGFIPSDGHPVPSVTTTATQTTDTLTFSRQQVKSKEELECERLSQDFVNCYGDIFLRNLLLPAPNHKTLSDYMEGLLDLKLDRGRKSAKLSSVPKAISARETNHSQPVHSNGCREEVSLPPTSAYFTTSEPKAKLLTRYNQNLDRQDWTDEAELTLKRKDLIASIGRKLEILRLEQVAIKEEMAQNEQLGSEVTSKVEKLAKSNELEKYRLHIEELEKIINLLLSLSGRLARAQNALVNLPKDAPAEEKCFLEAKRNKLNEQHDEARHLKESIDRRSQQVSTFLRQYLTEEEYADYDHFIMMKSKLLMDTREIDEKIKLGEEQLAALSNSLDAQVRNNINLELTTSTSPIMDRT